MNQEMLIIAVQKRPCIYDKSDQHYHNREYLKKSWEEIAFEVSESTESCQKRWRYLRDYYIKQRRVYMRLDGTRKKIWPMFDLLSFLNPFLQTYAEYTDTEIKDEDYNNFTHLNASGNPMEEELTSEGFMEDYQQTSSASPAPKRARLSSKITLRNEQSDDHAFFFKSLLPMVRTVDESKILQFRLEVQQVLMKFINSSNSNYSALNCLEDVVVVKRETQD